MNLILFYAYIIDKYYYKYFNDSICLMYSNPMQQNVTIIPIFQPHNIPTVIKILVHQKGNNNKPALNLIEL